VFKQPPFLFFQHNQQYDTLLPILPCTHKLKAGIVNCRQMKADCSTCRYIGPPKSPPPTPRKKWTHLGITRFQILTDFKLKWELYGKGSCMRLSMDNQFVTKIKKKHPGSSPGN
jgi:hypothetical protein